MLASVPKATVVIANPTHYAVALRYERGDAGAPMVVAKGLDNIALRIREIAESHDIPVIEDKALARSLYAAVSLDRPIPPEFYKAVAEIILYLMSRSAAQAPLPRGA
jgi:flagellar biosynthetic protein FlhB